MQSNSNSDKDAATLLFNHALLVAVEVGKAEAIVELAFTAAEVAMNAIGKSDQTKLPQVTRETLNISRHAAAEVLSNAKKEAEEMVRLANKCIGD